MRLFRNFKNIDGLYSQEFSFIKPIRGLYKYLFILPLCLFGSYTQAAGCLKYGDVIKASFATNNKFLVAEPDGSANANRTAGAQWESFLVQDSSGNTNGNTVNEGDKITLLSYHNKYLVAEPNGDVNANRVAIGDWEKWRIDRFNGTPNNPDSCIFMSSVSEQTWIALRSHHGKYLQATSSGGAEARLNTLDTASMPNNSTFIRIAKSNITVPPTVSVYNPNDSQYSCPGAFPVILGNYSNKAVCMARLPAKIKNNQCNKRGGMKWNSGTKDYCLWGKSNYWHARPTN